MSAKKKKKASSGQGLNFVVTLLTLSAVFVFFGYLIGTYAIGALQERHQTSMQHTQEPSSLVVSTQSVPVLTSPVASLPEISSVQAPPVVPIVEEELPLSNSTSTLYRVQVGVFSERANADRMVSLLKEAGYEGVVISGPPYRVQTGAFGSRENAEKLVEELIQKDFEAIIIR